MIKILGVSRFPWHLVLACVSLSIAASLVPRFCISPVVAGGAFLIAAYAVRNEVRRMQMQRRGDR